MKWGTRYPALYVNRLWAMIKRQTQRPTRLVCFTDDPAGVDAEVETFPLPDIEIEEAIAYTPWRKLSLWQAPLADLSGDVLFLDLDIVITGNLDAMFDFHPGKFCVCENWTQLGKGIGNTSVFRWHVGRNTHIFSDFEANGVAIRGKYRIEQVYISDVIDEMVFWPKEWCVSFKHTLMPRWPLNFSKCLSSRRPQRLSPSQASRIRTRRQSANGPWKPPGKDCTNLSGQRHGSMSIGASSVRTGPEPPL
nr:hypothetical protein [Marinicella sp. W31]MDC2878152.1 hypothetical protein [Marinicella sp. W31]